MSRRSRKVTSEPVEGPRSITWVRYAFGILFLAGMSLVFTMSQSFDVIMWNSGFYSFESFGEDILSCLGNEQLVFVSYFFGYVVFQPFAGRMAELYSAKWVLLSGFLVCTVLHALIPLMMKTSQVYVIIAGRFMSGVSSAVMYPAVAVLIARWTPPSERFAMCGLIYSGFYSGIAIGVFVTTWIEQYVKYEYVLYLEAGFSAAWLLCFAIYARDYPRQNHRMTKMEREMIVSSLRSSLFTKEQARQSSIPWKGIFTSPPFYALLVIQVGLQMVFHVTMARIAYALHTFQWKSDMIYVNRALLVASPFYWCSVVSVAVGMFFHILNEEKAITPNKALRFSVVISCISPLICLPADYFCRHAGELSIKPVLLLQQAGFHAMVVANHIFISPNYAGTILGLTNAFSTACGVVNRSVLENYHFEHTLVGIVYGVTAIVSLLAMILYLLLVSTNVQKWNQNLEDPKRRVTFEEPKEQNKKDVGKGTEDGTRNNPTGTGNVVKAGQKMVKDPTFRQNGMSWFAGPFLN